MSWILLFLLLFDFSIVNFISLTFSEFNLYKEEEFICVVDKISQLSFSILKSQHLLIALGFEIIFSFWHIIKSLLSLKALLTILFISFFKLYILIYLNLDILLNILSCFITFSILKLDISKTFREIKLLNKSDISITFDVLKEDKFIDINELHPSNIEIIDVTFDASKFPKLIYFKFLHPLNI